MLQLTWQKGNSISAAVDNMISDYGKKHEEHLKSSSSSPLEWIIERAVVAIHSWTSRFARTVLTGIGLGTDEAFGQRIAHIALYQYTQRIPDENIMFWKNFEPLGFLGCGRWI